MQITVGKIWDGHQSVYSQETPPFRDQTQETPPLIWRAGQILRSDLVRKPGLRKSDPGNPPLDLGERTPKSGSKGGVSWLYTD